MYTSRERKYRHPYYISPIEIGVLWAKITYVKSHLKVLDFSLQTDKQIWNRSFKWSTKHWFWSKGCKDIGHQRWSLKKNSANQPSLNPCVHGQPSWQILFLTSNLDLWYLCSPLIKINVWYLIWKIYFVFVWRTKPKAFERLLRYVIFAQIRPISIGLM